MGYAFIIEPQTCMIFANETEQMDKCIQWGLLSEKASKSKDYYYKGNGMNVLCSIIGYVDDITVVIEFENKQKHCVHPSYLKEMQASGFSQRVVSNAVDNTELSNPIKQQPTEHEQPQEQAQAPTQSVDKPATRDKQDKQDKPAKPTKSAKIELPVDKVKMTATVKEFTTVPNHFADEDDEVVIYEAVMIVEPEVDIGLAWSSHSATLKKIALEVGDTLSFDAKIAKKKLTKHPVPYKINNPSKILKVEF
jgi:hypothetical protein